MKSSVPSYYPGNLRIEATASQLARIRSGDILELDRFCWHNFRAMHRIVGRLWCWFAPSGMSRGDLVQELGKQLISEQRRDPSLLFPERYPHGTWITCRLRSFHARLRRRERLQLARPRGEHLRADELEVSSTAPSPEDELAQKQAIERILAWIGRLPEDEAIAYRQDILRFLDQAEIQETDERRATRLAVTENAIRVARSRRRQRLKAALLARDFELSRTGGGRH